MFANFSSKNVSHPFMSGQKCARVENGSHCALENVHGGTDSGGTRESAAKVRNSVTIR